MRYNHFSMLPEQAFKPRCGRFGGMTLEGGGGGGGGDGGGGKDQPVPVRPSNPQPRSPFVTAGGGFLGRGAPGNTVSQAQFDADRYLQQNPDVAKDPYYGKNPFHHYQDYGFTERRSPFEGFQYSAPSQQFRYNQDYFGLGGRPDLVTDAYQRIAGRAPDQEGFDYWTGQMNRGMTGQGLVGGFTASPEFQRQQQYNQAYTEAFRPGYKEFGPSGQYYQPIYQSRYQSSPSLYRPTYGGFSGLRGNPFAYMYEAGGEVDVDDQPTEPDQGIASLINK